MKSIRRRLAAAGTIAALTALAGIAYTAGNGAPAQQPAIVASANQGHNAAISTRASGRKKKKRGRAALVVAQAPARPTPLKSRASGHGRHGRGEREGRDDARGVDA